MNATLRGIAFLLLPITVTAGTTISPGHPELLQQGILDAYNAGQKSVVVPAGVYQVPSVNGKHLEFDNLNNFEIDARGATFVLEDVTAAGIIFYSCNGVYFHGATVYYATPPFSQGVVRAVASDASSIDIQIEQGYPTNLDDPKYFTPNIAGHLFDSTTRWWKRNANGDLYGTATQRLGTDTFRVFTPSFGGAVGDLIGFRPGTGGSIFDVEASSRMALSDLTILNSLFGGIFEQDSGGLGANAYTNITIKRGNRPANAVTDPLFSTSADGIHSTKARTGPRIENCSFESMTDDGIAIHGVYSWVMESSGNSVIVSYTGTTPNFQVGDTLQLIDTNDQPAGQAVVTGVTYLPAYTSTLKSARQTLRDFTVGPYYQLNLDRNVTAGFDYLAGNPGASGSGFVLLNNTIRNHRARGIIVKADNGTIQGNVIDGSTLAGIKAGPEFWWGEAGYVHNLVIEGNTINNVGYTGGGQAGILIAPDQGLTPPGGYQNITIDGNTFSNFDVPAIFLSSASAVTISNNIFTNLQNAVPFNPDYLGQNVLRGTLVFVAQSTGVQFKGNSLSQLGPVNAFFVEALPSASVSGVASVTPIASSDTDFSGTQRASGWNYGYFASGNVNAFTLLPTYDSTNARWQHTTFGPPWTALWSYSGFHPNGSDSGSEEWATRRWTSSLAGAATILGHLAKTDTSPNSPGVYGRIYVNHELLYEHFLQGTDGTGVDYSFNISLKNGDTIDFAVAPNGVEFDDATRFSSSILSTALLSQTITFGALNSVVFGAAPFPITATASSGLAVSFASTTTLVCTVSGSTVTVVAAGTCSITASQSGSANYAAAIPVTQSFTVNPATPAFFTGEVSLGSGVYYLQFADGNLLGYYSFVGSSIFYHYDMGYEAFVAGSGADTYLYDFASGHWWYTSSTLFPDLYDFTLNAWIYYFPNTKNPGHYSTNPRYFANLTNGQIFQM